MLLSLFVILLLLWILGVATGAILHGFIHLLLLIAVVVLVIRMIQPRPPVS